jgi:hypothetical protein
VRRGEAPSLGSPVKKEAVQKIFHNNPLTIEMFPGKVALASGQALERHFGQVFQEKESLKKKLEKRNCT